MRRVKTYTAILSFVQCSEMKLWLISAFCSTARAQHHHLIHQWSSQQLYVLTDWNTKGQLKLTPPSVKSFRHLKWAIEMVNIWIALNKLQSLLPKDRRLIGHLAPESHLRGTLPLWETCTSVSCRWNRAATYEASLMPHNYSRCWALKRRPCTTLLVGWEELKQAVIRIYIKSTDAWSCWRKWKFWCFSQTIDLFVYK